MSSLKYGMVLFLGMLLGLAFWFPGSTESNATVQDVPGDIFIEYSSQMYCPDNLLTNGVHWNTKIKINPKYLDEYRIGSVAISGYKNSILAMVTRIDQ